MEKEILGLSYIGVGVVNALLRKTIGGIIETVNSLYLISSVKYIQSVTKGGGERIDIETRGR